MSKQLIHSDGSTLAFALGNRGFIYNHETIGLRELHFDKRQKQKAADATSSTTTTSTAAASSNDNDDMIQAIAVHNNTIAVAFRSKKLCILQQMATRTANSNDQTTITTITTDKRIGKLLFTTTGSKQQQQQQQGEEKDMTILLAADMIGDVSAYKIPQEADPPPPEEEPTNDTKEQQQLPKRLLLGHTASIMMDLCLVESSSNNNKTYLVTADRDEKIRVSQFPNTHEIHGYLLSHTAFVSSMCQLHHHHIASVGGDGKLIVWDIETTSELASERIESTTTVPTKVLCVETTFFILCDEDTRLHRLSYDTNNCLTRMEPIQLSFTPIDMCHYAKKIAILAREAPYVRVYTVHSSILTEITTTTILDARQHYMIPNLLERDCVAKHTRATVRDANDLQRLPQQKDRIQKKRANTEQP